MSAKAKATSRDILDAVRHRWSAESHVIIEEAPEDRSRQGRKIDALVLGFWKTHGYEIEAVEVKVSANDLRKEIKDPKKSDFWWRHSNRFWIATTADVYRLCTHEIPDTWGVLVLNTNKGSLVKKVQAPKTKAEPLTHLTWLGMARALRADTDTVVRHAYNDGHKAGQEAATANRRESLTQTRYNDLVAKVQEFEQASGLRIANGWDLENVGQLVKTIRLKGPAEMAAEELGRVDRYREALASYILDGDDEVTRLL